MNFNAFEVVIFCGLIFYAVSLEVYPNKMRETEYDYIIVGAGSAGSVLANRLSEDLETKVLLLEAGGPPPGYTEIPFFPWEFFHTEVDWNYFTEPQEHACQGIKGKKSYHARGKVLGGSSTINGAVYNRGNHRDYDEWAKGGATGWSWEEVLHYFKKSEDCTDPNLVANGYHGTGGHLTVSSPTYSTPLQKDLLEAGKHLGYNVIDYNGEAQLGVSVPQFTIRDGLRCHTEKAFLRPVAHRENMDILVHAHVTKVLFDQDKRAYAVRFEQNGASRVIKARKEIILSAGVMGTPQLLMLSGIGPKEHLQDLGIEVIHDLPVGENFQDHMTQGGQIYLVNNSDTFVRSKVLNMENVGELLLGKGPLTVPFGLEMLMFANTKYQDPAEDWPDLQLSFVSTLFLPSVNDELEAFLSKYNDKNALSVFAWVNRPKGRGFIKLRSTDPYEHPIIDPKYLSNEDDVNGLIEGMKLVEELVQTPSLQKYNPVRVTEVIPDCQHLDEKSEEFLRCMASMMTLTAYHPCCSCRMGNVNQATTVVDPELRVKGVKGLRVVDSSVMPVIPSANTNAPTIMIAEKGADLIKGLAWDLKLQKVVRKTSA